VRTYTASLGLAILGTILVTEMRSQLTTSLVARGLPLARAQAEAAVLAQSRGSSGGSGSTAGGGGGLGAIPQFYRVDFAYATRTVFYVMAGIMAVATIVALAGLRRGLQEEPADVPGEAGGAAMTKGAGAGTGVAGAGAGPEATGTTGGR